MSIKEKASESGVGRITGVTTRWLAVLRISTGLVFLWAFADKLFGLGYATPAARAWIAGGSPTKGFLAGVKVGPFQDLFHGIAGAWWADWLFMAGLLGIGLAVTLGIGLRLAAVTGSVMLLLMWAAEWPPAQTTATGQPSGSTNPLIDYHVIYALVLVVLAVTTAGNTWGLGRHWVRTALVFDRRWLR
ncbi:DoxX family membrane protein [Kutzneria viridogrisea]|uniref:DoxX family protein n=2 Tax=Kutzneria TaxID=43356 RepID=W5W7L5_9PSEU|nr:DoxX family membrane protein [Kutzneria albida]AHH96932.1 DoxX family protein [Kutzneria albida DSM 43870]MBA8927845.1 thiosulfate dehydrogenase [quinone] large subunit [Kutzneria viridogrisea]